ncbi:glyoxylase-like metal-dependent hydrolase (beta-lactamase superfamily II) [Bacillus tianshenii]|uniref:Glyoxylase-like metal-dependent hydrolase (Beta-lactamase superfamily II) n=1 Tax=Sutcliffiella tianshenii TaxID=1463404 RepID=A0ABS2P020_9BACI|nr:glyoxylase-like metal-dependent hydrolase (beta-lactamase superfamily II) [Bacillus tianshenii]
MLYLSNLGDHVHPLPAGTGMNGWRWIHTPGHSHGHISLFRTGKLQLVDS